MKYNKLSRENIERIGKAFWGLSYEEMTVNHFNILKALDWGELVNKRGLQLFDMVEMGKVKEGS